MRGLVFRSTGSWYDVKSGDGHAYQCRIRGKLRISGIKTTNPIAVGDYVSFELSSETEGIIDGIEERDNYVIRKSIKNKHYGHIIAANIDQLVIIATISYPRTSLGFIDRVLVSCEAFRIPQVIIFNKIDLLDTNEHQKLDHFISIYERIGINCLKVSAIEKVGLSDVLESFKDKRSLITGHSGAGKSSIINALAPHLNLKTSEVSDFAEKGVHTTTYAEMFELENDTFIIDSPGIKELGLIDITDEELSDYFPEMRALIGQCKFHNCLHTHEPGCAVHEKVGEGEISEERFQSYLSMLEDSDNRR